MRFVLKNQQTRKRLVLLLAAAGTVPALFAVTLSTSDGVGDARASGTHTAFASRLAEARRAYFDDLEGKRGADDSARQQFAALEAERPHEPVLDAYLGSLELLESARTFAVWRKHTLAAEGLEKLDTAVSRAPDNLEARFVRALTTWHLPFFFHRKDQAEQDLSYIGPRAEQAARQGSLPAPLAAAALDYWGQILAERDGDRSAGPAREAFAAAVRVDPSSPGGVDASKRLGR
jgi:hypothetical protein